MATVRWLGNAAAVAQVDTLTVGGTIEADDVFKMTINGKTLSVVAGSTVAATVATTIAAAWNALTAADGWAEFAEITALATSGGALTLTADTKGKPFTCTVSTTETGGGAADAQTFGTAATVANSGPNDWSTATNWSGGAVPVDADDVIVEDSTIDILYGLDQSSIQPTSLTIRRSFTGKIGLPNRNSGGYEEYREKYLKIGPTTLSVGAGDAGGGSSRLKINTGTDQTAVTVHHTASPADTNSHAFVWKGTHAANTLTVKSGSVAVAPYAGETATIATLNVGYVNNVAGDSNVYLGTGCTLTTITQTGGKLVAQNNATTINLLDGELSVRGAATITTLNIDGGALYDESSGTFTTLNVGSGGGYDASRLLAAKTITTTNLRAGALLRDPNAKVTFTNGVVLSRCSIGELKNGTIDFGPNRTLTPS